MESFRSKIKNIPLIGDILLVLKKTPIYVVRSIKTRWYYFKQNHFPSPKNRILITDVAGSGDIYLNSEDKGFFAIVIELLDDISTNNDKEIDVLLKNTVYNDSKTYNMWDYYFDPIISGNGKKKTFSFNTRPYRNVLMSEKRSVIRTFHDLIDSRLRIKREITDKIGRFAVENFTGKKMIGIHCRGTNIQKSIDNAPHLLKKTEPEEYFPKVDDLLSTGFDGIFLATDDQIIFDKFKDRYGSKIVNYSKNRSASARGLFLYYSEKHGKIKADFTPREIGEEVLIDCVLLSKCQFLIHCSSNVSAFAKFINPKLRSINMDLKYPIPIL